MFAKFVATLAVLMASVTAQQPQVTVQNLDQTGNQVNIGTQTNAANSPATIAAGGPSGAQPTNCSSGCPPHWMSILNGFLAARGLPPALRASSPLCAFSRAQKSLFTACSSPQRSLCKTNPVNFLCCPMECLTTIKDCYDGPPTDSLCVPTDLQPWMQKIMSMVLGNMGHFGTSG